MHYPDMETRIQTGREARQMLDNPDTSAFSLREHASRCRRAGLRLLVEHLEAAAARKDQS